MCGGLSTTSSCKTLGTSGGTISVDIELIKMTLTFKNILLLTIILLKYNAYSVYVKTFLPSLIEKSKIIVHGKIVSVDRETFKIVTIKKIKSISKADTLTIQKFKDWTSASRYSKYEIGQEAIYFIELKKGKLKIIGDGNEGELFVKSDSAYFDNDGETVYCGIKFPTKRVNFLLKHNMYTIINLGIVIQGIQQYLENLKLIDNQIKKDYRDTISHRHDYIDKLPKNIFLAIIIDQRRNGY